ncbi:hypothetical protein BC938DRAFT_471925 [Jimgerdemannia flammicorona]|uniref:Uncharacterized protein n=1 Tax=Jimgerdemannia flammicorona TaxID=994334 RepID=A0A433Q736_9FUNG|nr:hypothetical protein BC938DRAFT_471925 [Jimgerdemannia flammicorona]
MVNKNCQYKHQSILELHENKRHAIRDGHGDRTRTNRDRLASEDIYQFRAFRELTTEVHGLGGARSQTIVAEHNETLATAERKDFVVHPKRHIRVGAKLFAGLHDDLLDEEVHLRVRIVAGRPKGLATSGVSSAGVGLLIAVIDNRDTLSEEREREGILEQGEVVVCIEEARVVVVVDKVGE